MAENFDIQRLSDFLEKKLDSQNADIRDRITDVRDMLKEQNVKIDKLEVKIEEKEEKLENKLEALRVKNENTDIQLNTLSTKAKFWGAGLGAVAGLILSLIQHFLSGIVGD